MAKRPDYDIGTVTLSSGSADFTTTGSALQTAAVQAGDSIITPSGHILIIASIADQNSGTLFLPCPAAAAGTDLPLRIRFQPDGSRYQGAARNMIDLLSSGNVEALAGLDGEAGKVPVFTGPGAMDLADPATFGIQDPNGSLGELAGLSRAPNQSLGTNNSGNLVFKNVPAEIIASDSSNTASAGWIKTGLGTRYREIVLHIDAAPTDNNVSIGLQLSTDNGSSWLSTTDDYTEQVLVVSGTSVTASNPASPAIVSGNVASATGGGGAMMEIKISEFNQFRRSLYSASITRRVSGGAMQFLSRNGIVTPWSPFNALRIVPTSGTLAWYRIVLTGIVG